MERLPRHFWRFFDFRAGFAVGWTLLLREASILRALKTLQKRHIVSVKNLNGDAGASIFITNELGAIASRPLPKPLECKYFCEIPTAFP
jgi:hypothetical protein